MVRNFTLICQLGVFSMNATGKFLDLLMIFNVNFSL